MHVQTDNKLAGPNLIFNAPTTLEIRKMDPKASIPKYNIGIEYVNAGMSPAESLAAGTINAARAAGVDHQVGSLEPGKAADIVAMSQSPLDDISSVLRLQFIMRDGVIFKQID